jgi:predicted DNA-binding WGR domain protein
MEPTRILLADFLPTAFDRGDYSTDDTIAFALPLFKKVLSFHEAGLVAPFEKEGAVYITGGRADIDETMAHAPSNEPYRIGAVDQHSWLPGYRCPEQEAGHHDPQTDVFFLGLLLGSIAMTLNLYDAADLSTFISVRINPSQQYPRLHPTLGRLITEMTEQDRARRSQDLYDIISRLEHYRDYDPEKRTDLSQVAGWVHKDLNERDAFILNRLRNRLFDISRRNRLLFYKPNMRFVNLTVGSVPVVLHDESIRQDLLFAWNPEIPEKIIGCKEIVLNKYLRFGDHEYLAAALDRARVESQRDVHEYGFSQLKLVIAFLDWHNLKEDAAEMIRSPLLLVPVSLKKNKKVKEDHFVLKAEDNAAEVNPVLAGQLRELYGIRLPDLVDLSEMSPAQFYLLLKEQIEEANQGILLHCEDKPDIPRLAEAARQTIGGYEKRMGRKERARSGEEGTGAGAMAQESGAGVDAGGAQEGAAVTDAGAVEQESGAKVNGGGGPARVVATNPYDWVFDMCNMVVGNFNYKKMSLVRDYNLVIDQRLRHHTFDALFGEQPRAFPEHPFDGNRPDDWYHVVTADPTQTRAILQSRAGYSYIIQGPPGTGKSQTITNLIADFVARGKNILFVCEKRAALDVVYHRLKQVGLEELCCYIHDSQSDKREFIRNLRTTYEDFIDRKLDLAGLKAQREAILNHMGRDLGLIREFHETCMMEGEGSGMAVKALIDRIIGLRHELVPLDPAEEEMLPSYLEWTTASAVVAGLEACLLDSGLEPVFSGHPFSRVNEAIFHAGSPYRMLEGLLKEALSALDDLETLLSACRLEPGQVKEPQRLKNLVQFAVLLYPLARVGQMRLADPDHEESKELERHIRDYQQLQEEHRVAVQKNDNWKERFEPGDLDQAVLLAAKHEGSFLGIFNGAYRRLRHQLDQRYDFRAHAVRPTYLHVLEMLRSEYLAGERVQQARRQFQERFRLEQNIDTARLSIDLLQSKKGHPELDYLMRHPDGAALVTSLQALHQPLNRLETLLSRCLHEQPQDSLSGIRDLVLNIQLNADSLRDWLPALQAFAGAPERLKTTLRRLPLRMRQVEAVIARRSLQELYRSHRHYATIDGKSLEKAVLQLGEAYPALQRLNAELIRAFVRQRFLHQLELSNRAGSQLSEDQRSLKKVYSEGRKILENEFGKTMRYKSIRELSGKESGPVLKAIKPVWLMSPYSVSDSLPLDFDHFDVVIFDEASQITLEEGVPALYRSRQAIIVGDEKQMPPTDFFNAGASKDNDPDDLDKPPSSDEDEWLTEDADSLLSQGVRKLESTLLSWHYRSHFETLISFSNHAFYGGELLTIPDKTIHHREKAPILVGPEANAADLVDSLFDRSISFHLLTNSVYEKRSNHAEATYIAQLVKELLRRETKESIGIVAFSQEQQHAIEAALEVLAGEDAAFAQQLEEAYNRTENDQFVGLIIKNLENIQGDERDIILISVCYGPDARGRMIMNFGPVNKKGGERRLNVLFSRARMHMAVVSSIRHEQITNEYNEGAGYLRRFLHYAELVSEGRMGTARAILDGLVDVRGQRAVQAPTVVALQLKEQLEARGYEVSGPVGQSAFKCSLAVKRTRGDEDYRLAILIDDEAHYRNENLIEQYYQRPAILRSFGWNVLPVFSKDWLHQPEKVLQLVMAVVGPPAGSTPGEPLVGGQNTGRLSAVQDLDSPAPGAQGGMPVSDRLSFRRLILRDGEAASFWEGAIDGNRLVVRWGKAGTRGQTRLRSFTDEGSALKELERQEKERRETGYESDESDQEPR